MKKFLWFGLLSALLLYCPNANSQQYVAAQFYSASGAVAGPGLFENSTASVHTISWTVVATVSACTIQLETSSAGASFALMSGSVAQTCTSSGTYTFSGVSANYVRFNITALTISGGGSLNVTYSSSYSAYAPNFQDGIYEVPLNTCAMSVPTTGVWAAGPASAGTYVGPLMARAAAGNSVLQGTTTGAASAINLDCDITPPSRTTAGKGVTVTGYTLWYGVQTTAFTSITAPAVNTVTMPAFGGAASGTVASAGGSLTTNPASLQLTTTTTGQCFSANVSFATPVLLNTANQRLTTTWIFNQTAAAAETLQICGLQVLYNNAPL